MTLAWYKTYDVDSAVTALRQNEDRTPLDKLLEKIGLDILNRTTFRTAALLAPSSTAHFIEAAALAYSLSLKTETSMYADAMQNAVSAGVNLLNAVESVAFELNPNYLTNLSNSIFAIMGLFEELQSRE